MNAIFKNLNVGGIVAFALAGLFAISWNAAKVNEEEPQWFAVVDHGSTLGDPANQDILGPYPNGEPGEECEEISGEICAIQLTFDPNETDMPGTVAAAIADPTVTVGDSQYKDEE